MSKQFLLRLSWPAKPLWQNRRQHWRDTRKAVRKARQEAWALALEAVVAPDPNATLEFQFHPPDNIRRDLQNLPATQKAAIDGIADAMGVDDNAFRCIWPTEFSQVVKGGCVLITIKTNQP